MQNFVTPTGVIPKSTSHSDQLGTKLTIRIKGKVQRIEQANFRLMKRFGLLLSFCCLVSQGIQAQEPVRIGVVLSGGGAKGAAHVGFLKALEELGVPIHAVSGASMGALVGAYYAAGWSPAEMDSLLGTADFQRRSTGTFPISFGFKRQDFDPSVVDVHVSSAKGWTQDHLIAGLPTDWGLMKDLSPASAAAREIGFDDLFVPFRCVASDVLAKSDTVFSSGDLATAARASMTFPFFLEPVEVEGRLLFDGGLYNNFPSDVLMAAFSPDVIIGCNVSSGELVLTAQDPASQIEAMITRPANLSALCEEMLVIHPVTGIGTFDFESVLQASQAGYDATMAQSDAILALIRGQFEQASEVQRRRSAYRKSLPEFAVGDVEVTGLNPGQTRYASRLLKSASGNARASVLERSLYLLVSDEHIAGARPTAEYNPTTHAFDVQVEATQQRDLRIEAGGSVSSNPVSFGHVGLSYSRFGRVPLAIEASSTFGNFYSAFSAHARIDWHGAIPLAIRPDFTLHRWNFERSFATFFQDVRPSYLVMSERQAGLSVFMPTGTNGVLWMRAADLQTTDDYYPNYEFNPKDTTDRIDWHGIVAGAGFRRSSMPKKAMNRTGNRFEVGAMRHRGTARDWLRDEMGMARRDTSSIATSFWRLSALFEQYSAFEDDRFSIGLRGEMKLSDEQLRRSYFGSIVQTAPFQPTPGSQIKVLERFRSYNFIACGAALDVILVRSLRWRGEAHVYRPFQRLMDTDKGPVFDERVGPSYLLGSWFVSDGAFGLITLGVEYYHLERNPWLFEFTLGHRVFNRSDRR